MARVDTRGARGVVRARDATVARRIGNCNASLASRSRAINIALACCPRRLISVNTSPTTMGNAHYLACRSMFASQSSKPTAARGAPRWLVW